MSRDFVTPAPMYINVTNCVVNIAVYEVVYSVDVWYDKLWSQLVK